MKHLRSNVIRAGFEALYVTGAHHLLRPIFGGAGAIFTLHHVRPGRETPFQPNHHLEITPEFLRTVLSHLREANIDIVTLDEMHRRMSERNFSRRFACFTFDDGYRDNRDFALPVMREFDAPFTVYVTSDFAQGTGRPWWVALERVVAKAQTIEFEVGGSAIRLDAATLESKQAAFGRVHEWMRALPGEYDIGHQISVLCGRHGIDEKAISGELCLSWDELKLFADDPLVTIGAHTITHCNVAKQSDAIASHEMSISRARIEATLQRPALHFSYPYGDRLAAGPREFELAQAAGFKTAVTTRPGMVYPENADHLMALPRVSLNGNYQNERILPILTSGAATAMWNGFRRVDAG